MSAGENLATALSLAAIGSSGEPGFPAESDATQPAFRRVIREANATEHVKIAGVRVAP
jgi:hypothetical protein